MDWEGVCRGKPDREKEEGPDCIEMRLGPLHQDDKKTLRNG